MKKNISADEMVERLADSDNRLLCDDKTKYIIKNCPALRYDRTKFKVCYDRNATLKCEDIDDCIIKRIVELCGKYHVINVGFQKVAINDLSADILKLLEIEEV